MFNGFLKAKQRTIQNMTTQGKQYGEQEKFFKEFWDSMRESFYEDNNTASATFILERFLSILPIKTIPKEALIDSIETIYKEKGVQK